VRGAEPADHRQRLLLRPRGGRPDRRRAEKREKIAPTHFASRAWTKHRKPTTSPSSQQGAAKSLMRAYIGTMAVSSPDLKAFLLPPPFFGGPSDASLERLVAMLVERRIDTGATMVAEGEPGRSMFIVHSGALTVSKLGDKARLVRMAGLGPGDFFGEMTLIEM